MKEKFDWKWLHSIYWGRLNTISIGLFWTSSILFPFFFKYQSADRMMILRFVYSTTTKNVAHLHKTVGCLNVMNHNTFQNVRSSMKFRIFAGAGLAQILPHSRTNQSIKSSDIDLYENCNTPMLTQITNKTVHVQDIRIDSNANKMCLLSEGSMHLDWKKVGSFKTNAFIRTNLQQTNELHCFRCQFMSFLEICWKRLDNTNQIAQFFHPQNKNAAQIWWNFNLSPTFM